MDRFSGAIFAFSLILTVGAGTLSAFPREVLSPDTPLCIKVAEYRLASFAKEKTHLDRLARQLGQQPGATSQIIVYGKDEGENQLRANRITNYLVRKRRVNPYRVIIEHQYCRAYFRTVLWIVPLGATRPAPLSCPN